MIALFKRFGSEDPNADNGGNSKDKQTEPATPQVQAAYAAAVTALGDKHAAGELDKDLASAAARRLGHVYRERYVAPPAATDGQSAKMKDALDAASRVRARLLGRGPTSREGRMTEVDISAKELQRTLLNLIQLMDQQDSASGASGQVLPTGWEKAVIESAGKLQAVARNIGNLAREHERIATDYMAGH